jgi:hypothetical protein
MATRFANSVGAELAEAPFCRTATRKTHMHFDRFSANDGGRTAS